MSSWLKLPRKVADVGGADRPAAGSEFVVGERVQVDFLQGSQVQKLVRCLAHEFKGFEVENVVVVHDVFLSLLLSSVRRIKTGRDGASPAGETGNPESLSGPPVDAPAWPVYGAGRVRKQSGKDSGRYESVN